MTRPLWVSALFPLGFLARFNEPSGGSLFILGQKVGVSLYQPLKLVDTWGQSSQMDACRRWRRHQSLLDYGCDGDYDD